ncbi:hypothetical protein GCM10011578_034340 [Streptomyces fuscichromogenes]|uniref:Uncharacterized protein n=1 Tax=Streptomyces fuscichromogenes TaxID=1324013 RepID=A0A918CRU1_9ACTN|nr:hypothetical protein GCM10011578_034340 [Streptomyces fuscichromogenes]
MDSINRSDVLMHRLYILVVTECQSFREQDALRRVLPGRYAHCRRLHDDPDPSRPSVSMRHNETLGS